MNKLRLKTEITRTALFLAARDGIVKQGYDRAQLAMIAKQAGRTRGSIYNSLLAPICCVDFFETFFIIGLQTERCSDY